MALTSGRCEMAPTLDQNNGYLNTSLIKKISMAPQKEISS
jgi:hypothetical protein